MLVLAGYGRDQSSSGRIFKSFGLVSRCGARLVLRPLLLLPTT